MVWMKCYLILQYNCTLAKSNSLKPDPNKSFKYIKIKTLDRLWWTSAFILSSHGSNKHCFSFIMLFSLNYSGKIFWCVPPQSDFHTCRIVFSVDTKQMQSYLHWGIICQKPRPQRMQNRNKMSFECCHLQHEGEFKMLSILWKWNIEQEKHIFILWFKRLYGELTQSLQPPMNFTLRQSKTAHILITERHANKSKDLFIPTVLFRELSKVLFNSV